MILKVPNLQSQQAPLYLSRYRFSGPVPFCSVPFLESLPHIVYFNRGIFVASLGGLNSTCVF